MSITEKDFTIFITKFETSKNYSDIIDYEIWQRKRGCTTDDNRTLTNDAIAHVLTLRSCSNTIEKNVKWANDFVESELKFINK